MSVAGRRPIALVLFGAALAGCVPLSPPQAVSGSPGADRGVAVREHLSGRFVELIGVKAQHAPPYLGTPDTNFYCLRSVVDRRSGETADQLYVADSYDGKERNWDAAHDGDGRALRFIPISRREIVCDAGRCAYAEEFAADIPERELRANPHGLRVTFTDRAGDRKAIGVSAEQIVAQLAAVAAQLKPGSAPAVSNGAPFAAAHQP
ncbi:MAG TPA: hypothetical protein VGM07_16150 [Stellaceae bacterium]|jgi:hypothetical protein